MVAMLNILGCHCVNVCCMGVQCGPMQSAMRIVIVIYTEMMMMLLLLLRTRSKQGNKQRRRVCE